MEQRESSGLPNVIILAGPNGAGKTTAAPTLIRDHLGITEFVNADWIAQGLSAFAPESSAIAAGRIMLGRLRELSQSGRTFAFETTLATRSFAPWIQSLKGRYTIRTLFLYLQSADLAVERVRRRVRSGGHDVSEQTVRRRYRRGLQNLFNLYMPMMQSWHLIDNSGAAPVPIASGGLAMPVIEHDPPLWDAIREEYSHV